MIPAPLGSVLLAGGGTAGHVNPLLAVAEELARRDPATRLTVLGTATGLEAELVPARGLTLALVPRVPFTRPGSYSAGRFLAFSALASNSVSRSIAAVGLSCAM